MEETKDDNFQSYASFLEEIKEFEVTMFHKKDESVFVKVDIETLLFTFREFVLRDLEELGVVVLDDNGDPVKPRLHS